MEEGIKSVLFLTLTIEVSRTSIDVNKTNLITNKTKFETIEVKVLRRGVLGVNKIGYVF